MKVYTAIPPSLPSLSLAIGVFDGVHRGHSHLLSHLRGSTRAILTFSNHPLELLRPPAPPLLTPLPLKLTLLQSLSIDLAIILPFTPALSHQPYEEFLSLLPLKQLLLGEGDAFGRGREGTFEKLSLLGKKRGFEVTSVPKAFDASSRKIRSLIAEGDLKNAAHLLGRPHLLTHPFHSPCLPSFGTYTLSSGEGLHRLDPSTQSLTPPLTTHTLLSFDPKTPPRLEWELTHQHFSKEFHV